MCGGGIGNLLFPLAVEGELANGATRPANVLTLQATCPSCKSKVSSAFDWCPQCGTGLKPHACAYCGNQMESNARFCPSCGAPAGGRGRS